MKRTLLTLIVFSLYSFCYSQNQDLKNLLKNTKSWTGSFSFSFSGKEEISFLAQSFDYSWSASGSFQLEPSTGDEDIILTWEGENQQFTASCNDTEKGIINGETYQIHERSTGSQVENCNSARLVIDLETMTYTFSVGFGCYEIKTTMDLPANLKFCNDHSQENALLCWPVWEMQERLKNREESFSSGASVENLPITGTNLSGSKKIDAKAQKVALDKYLQGTLSWSLSPGNNETKIEVKSLSTSKPHCCCDTIPIEFTATTNLSGGAFEKFKINYHSNDKHPVINKNEGGQKPALTITPGKPSCKISIIAVYKKEGKFFESTPFEMNFCYLKKPKFLPNASNSGGSKKNEFVYSTDDVPYCDIDAYTVASLNGSKIPSEKIKWDISPNPETWKPENMPDDYAAKIRITSTQLPVSNTEFGKKILKATYNDEQCECETEQIEAKVFFARDVKNNPEKKMPNWAYYWKQTKAGQNIPFEVVAKIPSNPGDASENPNVIARYDQYQGKIFMIEKFTNTVSPPCSPGGVMNDGIDHFAINLRHENCHKDELTSWWGPNFKNYSAWDDVDGDLVPNSVEDNTAGCDKQNRWSCPGRPTWITTVKIGPFEFSVTDIEMNAYRIGCSWSVGSADQEDWASPGRQYDK